MSHFLKKIIILLALFLFKSSYADFDLSIPESASVQKKHLNKNSKPNKNQNEKNKNSNPPSSSKSLAAPQSHSRFSSAKKTQLPSQKNKEEIFFEADEATVLKNKNQIILRKNVLFTKGDVKIKSDKSILYFNNNSENKNNTLKKDDAQPLGNSNLTKAEAFGNVHMTKTTGLNLPDLKTESDEAIYEEKTHTITLKGRAKAWKGQEYVHSNQIEIDTITNDIHVVFAKGMMDS